MELRVQCIRNGFDTFGSRFVPIGKTVGTFCMWYVPVKCFLGRLGTNKWHFVPGESFFGCRGTNKCHFVPGECVESLEGGRGNPGPPVKEPTPERWRGLPCICSFCQCSSYLPPALLERFCLRRLRRLGRRHSAAVPAGGVPPHLSLLGFCCRLCGMRRFPCLCSA